MSRGDGRRARSRAHARVVPVRLRRPARAGRRDPRGGGRRRDADHRGRRARARRAVRRRPAGGLLRRTSDMAMFSFHPVKPITTAEGGMVTTRDPRSCADRLRRFRIARLRARARLRRTDQGGWYHEQHDLGFNYRLSDVHSALGAVADGTARRVRRRPQRRSPQRYRDGLGGRRAIELPPAAPEGGAARLPPVRDPPPASGPRGSTTGCASEGILVQVHYLPVYWHPYYMDRCGLRGRAVPGGRGLLRAPACRCPCFPTLTEADQDRVIEAVRRLA